MVKAAKPVCMDLYCGLGGWAEGFLSEGYEVIGYDIEKHDYGTGGYPGKLVLRDVLRLNGAKCKCAAVIVASPPCQEPSYRAMPWSRAKALNDAGPPHKFIALFEACFRIQREASEAAGRYIPLVIENVKGAQRWVGPARWHFGSFYLWGDVPALMPIAQRLGRKVNGQNWSRFKESGEVSAHWRMQHVRNGDSHTKHLTNPTEHVRIEAAGIKMLSPGHHSKPGSGPDWFDGGGSAHWSGSIQRKAASALIAKIPFPLSSHIARCFKNGATHD